MPSGDDATDAASGAAPAFDEAPWIAAGVLDPDADDAAECRELVEYLAGFGYGPEDLLATPRKRWTGLAGDALLGGRPTRTIAEVSTSTGMSPDVLRRTLLATGFAAPDDDDSPAVDDATERLLGIYSVAAATFGDEATRSFLRVMASSMARIAEAADAMFITQVEQPLVGSGGRPVEVARSSRAAVEMALGLPEVMALLFRRHLQAAIERSREARDGGRGADAFRRAIGFADLVGSTALARRLDRHQLSLALDDFERDAHELVTAAGGRIVKSIGDAVLVVGPDAGALASALLGLADRVHANPLLTEVRCALTAGEVLARDGDYFGPVVNLAARIVKEAAPGEVVTAGTAVTQLRDAGFVLDDLGERTLHGIDEPVGLHRVRDGVSPDPASTVRSAARV